MRWGHLMAHGVFLKKSKRGIFPSHPGFAIYLWPIWHQQIPKSSQSFEILFVV